MGPGDMFAQPISESYNWVRISVKCDFLVPGHQGNWGPPLELVCMSGVGVGVGVRVVCTGVYGSGLARWESGNLQGKSPWIPILASLCTSSGMLGKFLTPPPTSVSTSVKWE